MKALYDRMDSLPPRLQMFLAGCPAELEAKRDRINCRQVVMRTLLALAEGVHRTAYWNLAPEYPGPVDHLQMMHLLIGKLPLLGYRDGDLAVRHPAAESFALLAEKMADARSVSRVSTADRPGLYAFEVDRAGRGPLLVIWDHRDPFDGEDELAGRGDLAVAAGRRHRHRRVRPHLDGPLPGHGPRTTRQIASREVRRAMPPSWQSPMSSRAVRRLFK